MIKIYGRRSSINVRKVLWCCEELSLGYDREDWGAGFRSTQSPEFLALNPNGLVPVIDDQGYVLWQSNAIVRYLANCYGGAALYPDNARIRGQIDQWIDWQATELNDSWRYCVMGLVRKSSAHQDPVAIQASTDQWSKSMAILEAQLSQTTGYLVGDRFTLADIPIGLSVHRWFAAPISRPSLPAIARYYQLLNEREGFRRQIDEA